MKKLYLTLVAVYFCWTMAMTVSADVPAAAVYGPMGVAIIMIGVVLIALGFAIYHFLKKRKK